MQHSTVLRQPRRAVARTDMSPRLAVLRYRPPLPPLSFLDRMPSLPSPVSTTCIVDAVVHTWRTTLSPSAE